MMQDKQDNLLKFVQDPETIRKAVEGSMERRWSVMKDKHFEDLREKLDWVRKCQCERPLCAEEIAKGEHDQTKTGCPSCDFAHADYPLFRNKEVLALITTEQLAILERLLEKKTKLKAYDEGGVTYTEPEVVTVAFIQQQIDRIGGKE